MIIQNQEINKDLYRRWSVDAANCQDTGCPYYQIDRILDLITKAEEE